MNEAMGILIKQGVTEKDIIDIAIKGEKPHYPNIAYDDMKKLLYKLLSYNEVVDVIMTAYDLDRLAGKAGTLSPWLEKRLLDDNPNFGLDEWIVQPILGHGGSIAWTNYGNVDKQKDGLVGEIDQYGKEHKEVSTTMLDDIVGALASTLMGMYSLRN